MKSLQSNIINIASTANLLQLIRDKEITGNETYKTILDFMSYTKYIVCCNHKIMILKNRTGNVGLASFGISQLV